MKFYKNFSDWSDALDRKAKKHGLAPSKVRVRKVEGGYVASIGKEQIGTFTTLRPNTGGYVY